MSDDGMKQFGDNTRKWFHEELGKPTIVQESAWPIIASGSHTLVSAPTGTGKTLTAFLVFIDRLKEEARRGELRQELQLIYVSPLKSLASDIRENLRKPLDGIYQEELREFKACKDEQEISKEQKKIRKMIESHHPMDLSVAIRTGDTSQRERQKMIKNPPHILITTPESLYLLLTSKSGKTMLKTARYVIVDELHALIDSKRGAHLMLSLARLDLLCGRSLQRIGLSATIQPLETAAKYLSTEPVEIIAPKMEKKIKLEIISPLPEGQALVTDSIWQELSRTVYHYCEGTRSVIAFVEGRRYAEKLAYYINEIGGDGFARVHHGSMSKEQRFEVEESLRSGTLRMLCATSSMELGIDVGEIDRVFQIGCPRSISSTMQRLGRAGHRPDEVSTMYLFPRAAAEGLYCGMTAEIVRQGEIECCKPPQKCLDVLAQHLVSMACEDGYTVDDVMALLARTDSFAQVTREEVCNVLRMLAGDYEHDRNIPVRPRILYDRIHERVEGDPYSRMLAISAGGTIPDKGLYAVKTRDGVKLGELDEEFVFESLVGERFLLGTFAWKIKEIKKDAVVVSTTNTTGAKLPFWKGEIQGRKMQTGILFGSILRKLNQAHVDGNLLEGLFKLGLDLPSAQKAQEYLNSQIQSTGILPDEQTILVEHYKDSSGSHQMMVHSVFGRQVNAPLAILMAETVRKDYNLNLSLVEDDDGILLYPYNGGMLPEGILQRINPDLVMPILSAILPTTPLFNINFRYNAARALMMGAHRFGRQPLWVQRLRSADMLDSIVQNETHPLIQETTRECLNDLWDIKSLDTVLRGIQSGNIQVREMYQETPSPMSFLLRQQTEGAMMYNYTPTPVGIIHASEEKLDEVKMLSPTKEDLIQTGKRFREPEDEKQLHSLMMIEGDFIAGEIACPIEWLESLVNQELAQYIEPGLWIAMEKKDEYLSAFLENQEESQKKIILRMLRYRGGKTEKEIAERYFYTHHQVGQVLKQLLEDGDVVVSDGVYYQKDLYDRARNKTIKSRREEIHTMPAASYAAVLVKRLNKTATPMEQLALALEDFVDQYYAPEVWEGTLLPGRVRNYRPELLDQILAQGDWFWQMDPKLGLAFHRYKEVDWEEDLTQIENRLEGNEKILYEALRKRGASFLQNLSNLIDETSPYDTLMTMAKTGLVSADSFLPVRQWLMFAKIKEVSVKQRVSARVKMMSAGRWNLVHSRAEQPMEDQLLHAFDRSVILCRETAGALDWSKALEVLRVWEYTGQVRRGYFVEGLSGIQFVREKDFLAMMNTMNQPGTEINILPAIDPAQPWGKIIAHQIGKEFLNVAGTVVIMQAGDPIAVMERKGKVLRILDGRIDEKAIQALSAAFQSHCILTDNKRITVKEYPKSLGTALQLAGFIREMGDYVLYRS